MMKLYKSGYVLAMTLSINWKNPRQNEWKIEQKINNILFCFLPQAEFISGLLKVVEKKLEKSIPLVLDDDNLFSHLIDELLLFSKELHLIHHYHSIEHNCLHILTTDACLQRWVELERNSKWIRVKLVYSNQVVCGETVNCHWSLVDWKIQQ